MKKLFQKILFFFLTLVVASSSLLQPVAVRAVDIDIMSTLCLTSDGLTELLTAIGLGHLAANFTDGPWYDPTVCSFRRKVFGTREAPVPDDQLFGERYTYAQINWITYSIMLQTMGRVSNIFNPANAINLFTENRQYNFKDFVAMGPPGVLIGSISEMLSHPPASGVDSVMSTIAKFDVASPVHAQGFGYNSTSFLRPLWTASRNMAYAIMVILLIASGFLIMFRIKINPQTAVTLQLMIPRIILTLLAVTFSYAIAGFIIDLVFVLLSVFISLLAANGLSNDGPESIRYFLTPGFDKIFFYYATIWITTGWGVLVTLLGPIWGLLLTLIIFWLLFKVWWMMLKTYLTLMFLIIIGPWQIMLGILPGQQGFGSWLRNVIANVSVFAVVPIMFIFNMIFWDSNGLIAEIIEFLNPVPFILDFFTNQPHIVSQAGTGILPALPLFGSTGFFFNFALGYAVLALIPKTSDMVRDALKAPAFKYGSAFGEALGPARNIGRKAWGSGQGWATGQANDYYSRTRDYDSRKGVIDVLRGAGILQGRPGSSSN